MAAAFEFFSFGTEIIVCYSVNLFPLKNCKFFCFLFLHERVFFFDILWDIAVQKQKVHE